MKKVCYVTTVASTIKAFVIPVINHLDKYTDWDISVICSNDDEFVKLLPENVHFFPVEMKRGISMGGIIAMLKMIRIFRREKFDLVQYSTPNAALYASIAARVVGVRHRLYHLMGFRYDGFCGIKRHIFRFVELLTCKLSTTIECVSESNLKWGVEEKLFPIKKAHVLNYGSSAGVDFNRFNITQKTEWRNQIRTELQIDEADCVFCFAGRITADKGVNELFKAFLRIESDASVLLIVGRLENEESLDSELVRKIKLSSNVRFVPYVNDIEKYYAAADVLVLPSYREGFGNVVIEAEAMGVPVIVTDIPGPTDAMLRDETGLVVEKADVDSLYKAMCRMMDDSEMRERFSQSAYRFAADRFDQKKLIEFIVDDRRRLLSDYK